MKKNLMLIAVAIATTSLMSCSKQAVEVPQNSDGLSATEVSLIQNAGLQATGATKTAEGYLIEGDILLTAAELQSLSSNNGPEMIVANSEQYRTTNLVTGLPRTLTVRYTGSTTSISNAVTAALARYNGISGLRIKFSRISSGNANITINNISGQSYIASAGFPSGGNPYGTISFNTAYAGWTANTLTSVIAHEMGHCIGFRHTDYMDRSYSCGGSYYNEGSAGIGAIHIPGTPTGPDPNSWMLACIGNGTNRPFNANDLTALNYVY